MVPLARIGLCAGALLLIGCVNPGGSGGGDGPDGDAAPVTPVANPNAKAIVTGQQEFAADLYGRFRGQAGNLLFSPYSIHEALSVVREGAKGATAQALDAALRLPAEGAHDGWGALTKSVRGDGRATLRVGNRLWVAEQFRVVPSFEAAIQATHAASVVRRDLGDDNATANEINAWVNEVTEGMIPQTISPANVPDLASLMLVNAIYFHGKWRQRFDERATRPEPFTAAAGERVDVPMMHVEADFRHASHDGVETLALPYRGGSTEFVIALPADPNGLAKVESELTGARLQAWCTAGHEREVRLSLPRFRFENRHNLMPTLAGLGLPLSDPRRTDLSGIGADPRGPLFLARAEHVAVIEVDEEGTKAAAATVVSYACAGPAEPPIVFRCDRPFLFLIRHVPTGAILFLGRVTSPPRD
jgi:serpin B